MGKAEREVISTGLLLDSSNFSQASRACCCSAQTKAPRPLNNWIIELSSAINDWGSSRINNQGICSWEARANLHQAIRVQLTVSVVIPQRTGGGILDRKRNVQDPFGVKRKWKMCAAKLGALLVRCFRPRRYAELWRGNEDWPASSCFGTAIEDSDPAAQGTPDSISR
jgi:hypothetical protein